MHKKVKVQSGLSRWRSQPPALLGLVALLWLVAFRAEAAEGENPPGTPAVADAPSNLSSPTTPEPSAPAAKTPAVNPAETGPAAGSAEKGTSSEKTVRSKTDNRKKKRLRSKTNKKKKRRRAKRGKAGRNKKKRRCQTYTTPRYKKMRRRWLKQPKIAKPRYREGFRDMSFYAINLGERLRIQPYLPDGELDPEALKALEPLFRDKHDNATHAIHPRLIKLLYKILDHFKARQITIISGYRSNPGHASESNHARGRAIDFVVPGVPVAVLARYVRRLGKVGVGHYPNAGFVHLDVRERWSYFWVDRSGPGKPQCPNRVLAQAGQKIDARYRPRHDRPRRRKDRRGRPLGSVEKMGAAAP